MASEWCIIYLYEYIFLSVNPFRKRCLCQKFLQLHYKNPLKYNVFQKHTLYSLCLCVRTLQIFVFQ